MPKKKPKSNAGRKPIPQEDKKVQMSVSLSKANRDYLRTLGRNKSRFVDDLITTIREANVNKSDK